MADQLPRPTSSWNSRSSTRKICPNGQKNLPSFSCSPANPMCMWPLNVHCWNTHGKRYFCKKQVKQIVKTCSTWAEVLQRLEKPFPVYETDFSVRTQIEVGMQICSEFNLNSPNSLQIRSQRKLAANSA